MTISHSGLLFWATLYIYIPFSILLTDHATQARPPTSGIFYVRLVRMICCYFCLHRGLRTVSRMSQLWCRAERIRFACTVYRVAQKVSHNQII